EWAFDALGLRLADRVPLRRIQSVYEVTRPDGGTVQLEASMESTAQALERRWAGSGARYERFVRRVGEIHARLRPLLHISHPTAFDLLRSGAWRDARFLSRGLASILEETGLPGPARDAIGIWTHVAGQRLTGAPAPLAFVPMLIHRVGAFYPADGIRSIPRALSAAAQASGVDLRLKTSASSIATRDGRVTGVETESGDFLSADAVVSNVGGPATYLRLVRG